MYLPKHFEETRSEVLHALIRARPLATLVTLASNGLEANHIPLHLVTDSGVLGTLRGHVARANPLWRDYSSEVETLAIFHGPNSYVSPSWYPSKREHGKVVPTWNYAAVHAYGRLRTIDDPVWLGELLDTLTSQHEVFSTAPWTVSDAPADYVEKMMGAIVGIEIEITRLSGKWKLSQNQPVSNRAGVVDGLRARSTHDALETAEWMDDNEAVP